MNYIKLINQFWAIDQQFSFSPIQTRLYFFLVHTCNRLGWKKVFNNTDRHTALMVGISINTMKKNRIVLKQTGLIDFIVGGSGRKACQYKILIVKNEMYMSNYDTLSDTLSDSLSDTQIDYNIKHKTKTKTIKRYKENNESFDERFKNFQKEVFAFKNQYEEKMLNEFIDYWGEANRLRTKMNWEMKPTWELSKRLKMWFNNSLNFRKEKKITKKEDSQKAELLREINKLSYNQKY